MEAGAGRKGLARLLGLFFLDRDLHPSLLPFLNLWEHRDWRRYNRVAPLGIALFLDGHPVSFVHPRGIFRTRPKIGSDVLLGDGQLHGNAGITKIVRGAVVLEVSDILIEKLSNLWRRTLFGRVSPVGRIEEKVITTTV